MNKKDNTIVEVIASVIRELPTEYNYMYLGLYGSQNYGLDHKLSDFDFIAIVMPTIDDLIKGRMTSVQHELDGIGHVVIKDIRLFFNELEKGNLNYYEVLCTKYYKSTNKYTDIMNNLRSMVEPLAKLNSEKIYSAAFGMMTSKCKNLTKESKKYKDEVLKYGYASKRASSVIRLSEFIQSYFGDYNSFSESIDMDGTYYKQVVMDILEYQLPKEAVVEILDEVISQARAINKNMNELKFNQKYNIPRLLLDSIEKQIIEEHIKEELNIK